VKASHVSSLEDWNGRLPSQRSDCVAHKMDSPRERSSEGDLSFVCFTRDLSRGSDFSMEVQ